jgi:hypothetical protein
MKMMFPVNLVYKKVVDNLPILLVLNFHGNRPDGLRIIDVGSWSSEMLVLWKYWTDLEDCFVWPS